MPFAHPFRASDQILTVAQMRAAEEDLIAAGIGVDELMQRAGRGAGEYVRRLAAGRAVTVLCGPGNNGGDGYVIAQHLAEHGTPVQVIAAREPATDAARTARALFSGPVLSGAVSGPDAMPHCDVLVDCLFGSGLTRPLPDDLVSLLTGLAERHVHCVAIDLPSGVESDSGMALNEGLPKADLTIALGAWKFAHWSMPASAAMGVRRLVGIGVGIGVGADSDGAARLLARPRISAPAADAHKYRRGLLAIVAGAMPGAPVLAADAAMRGGAGYVKVLADAVPQALPCELVCDSAPLDAALADPRIAALLIGPGLGRDRAARERLGAALARGKPTVIDADALMLLSPDMPHGAARVLTPHEGEMVALERSFGLRGADLTGGSLRRERAMALAKASRATVVLKGPDTVIAGADGSLTLCPAASSWLSVAGTGDVLAGLVASRLAVHGDDLLAAREGVWLHGEAARLAGPVLTAGELARHCSQALAATLV